jgi:hypothetical protein
VYGVHHVVQRRVEELLGGLGVEATDEFGGVLEVGKQHRHLLALAFQCRAGRQDLVGKMGWRVGQWHSLRRVCTHRHRCSGWRRRDGGTTGPDQHGVVLIYRHLVHFDEFELEILDVRLVQVELAFEGPIRHPALALQQGHRLVQDLLKGHRRPSALLDTPYLRSLWEEGQQEGQLAGR